MNEDKKKKITGKKKDEAKLSNKLRNLYSLDDRVLSEVPVKNVYYRFMNYQKEKGNRNTYYKYKKELKEGL